jgi:hypothetical protein
VHPSTPVLGGRAPHDDHHRSYRPGRADDHADRGSEPVLTLPLRPTGGLYGEWPGYEDFEVVGLQLLASGRPLDVLLHVTNSGRNDLVAQLLWADAQVRLLSIDGAALQGLVERVHREEAPGSRLRSWASAMLAERLMIDGDVAALLVARHGLDELRESGSVPVLPPVALRYARARLTRVEAGSWLLVPARDGLATHLALRDQTIADLLACGFTEEMHVTRGVAAGLLANVLLEDITENHERLVDARAALGEHDSMWGTIIDSFLGISAFEVGDLVASLEAFDRMERSVYRHRRVDVVHRYGRAFFRLVNAGASPLTIDGIEKALGDVSRHDPRVAQWWYAHVTHTLADMGSRAAAHFARLESELPALDEMSRVGRRLLRLRVEALAGEPVTVADALSTLEVELSFGHVRRAARCAVRLAHDLASGGNLLAAHEMHRWGMERMVPPARRTVWETWWARPVEQSRQLAPPRVGAGSGRPVTASTGSRRRPAAAALSVRVLSPTVEVEVEGEPVTLSDAQAKLLLALVVNHPAPLHVERASDVLWPDEPLAVTRSRLNSLVHRLRRVLHPHGEAVGRSGALLQLDETKCAVDLWWFQRALAGGADDRRKALLSVRGNLGDAQFPYDEGFFDERHRVSGEWVRHACRAHRGGEVAIAELEPALTSLKLTSADLDARAL